MSSTTGRRLARSACALVLALIAPVMVESQSNAADSTVPVPSPSVTTSYRPSGS